MPLKIKKSWFCSPSSVKKSMQGSFPAGLPFATRQTEYLIPGDSPSRSIFPLPALVSIVLLVSSSPYGEYTTVSGASLSNPPAVQSNTALSAVSCIICRSLIGRNASFFLLFSSAASFFPLPPCWVFICLSELFWKSLLEIELSCFWTSERVVDNLGKIVVIVNGDLELPVGGVRVMNRPVGPVPLPGLSGGVVVLMVPAIDREMVASAVPATFFALQL